MVRYEYIDGTVDEKDLHPTEYFGQEHKLARSYLSSIRQSPEIQSCPISDTIRQEILFEKWGWRYALSPDSWTVSLTAFPNENIVKDYFYRSPLAKLRASSEYQTLAKNNRKELWENQVGWIEGRVSRYMGNEKYQVIDWGSRYVGWVEYLQSGSFVNNLTVKEPLPPIQQNTEESQSADIICLIDVLQRQTDPQKLLQRLSAHLKPGGLIILCCRAGSGFDLLTLGGAANSIFPLDHIFLPSPKGMELLLEKTGYQVLEITTPGLLDMTLVKNVENEIPKNQYFLRYLLDQKEELLLERMQGFLQRNNLSSHMRCVARKNK